jgi:hypothetical protein
VLEEVRDAGLVELLVARPERKKTYDDTTGAEWSSWMRMRRPFRSVNALTGTSIAHTGAAAASTSAARKSRSRARHEAQPLSR